MLEPRPGGGRPPAPTVGGVAPGGPASPVPPGDIPWRSPSIPTDPGTLSQPASPDQRPLGPPPTHSAQGLEGGAHGWQSTGGLASSRRGSEGPRSIGHMAWQDGNLAGAQASFPTEHSPAGCLLATGRRLWPLKASVCLWTKMAATACPQELPLPLPGRPWGPARTELRAQPPLLNVR